MNDLAFQIFWAPLAVGAILWLVAEAFRSAIVLPAARRRARRRHIITLMGRAESLMARAVWDGLYDRAWIEKDLAVLDELRVRYDDLTAETLDLFVRGEEQVAFWAAAEFYAGFFDPLVTLHALETPRQAKDDGQPLLRPLWGWDGPRADLLIPWAARWWPWVRGNTKGPMFGDLTTGRGDGFRHEVVRPNTEVPADMLLPFIWKFRERSQIVVHSADAPLEPHPPRTTDGGL